ncbi:MAG: 3-hydroxybutyryl-CoA dehydrogenase [Spirochaetaceae bacterium]|nr:3-hydroxybutyryl-CoA dehydrogenase [Spirochaetaceae bacterium]
MDIQKIGIVGSGTMGSGIAQVAAHAGSFEVLLCDVEQRFLDRGMETIRKGLSRIVQKGGMDEQGMQAVLARITTTTDLTALAQTDFIIEAASENLQIKEKIFRTLDGLCPPDKVLASNTSTIAITRLASFTAHPDRVVGMHFFNPAPVMKLVELTRGLNTGEPALATARAVATRMGKTAVDVHDSPGFIVNRVLVPMINEAAYLLMEGVAEPAAIDEAMKLGAAHPMGPLALADLIGLDVCLSIMEILQAEFGEDKYRPCPLLRRYVEAGRLGRKTGRGFFEYQ